MLSHLIKKGAPVAILAVLFLIFIVPLTAQSNDNASDTTSFKDSELKKFARVMEDVQTVQTDSNQKIEDAFSDSSMSKERFNTLYSARQNENKQKADDGSKEETQEFNDLAKQIQTIQQESQKEMVEKVREHDMTVQKFNQIVQAMRQNPELGRQIQQLM